MNVYKLISDNLKPDGQALTISTKNRKICFTSYVVFMILMCSMLDTLGTCYNATAMLLKLGCRLVRVK